MMGYVVGLGLQNPELKILFQPDIWLLRYNKNNNKGNKNSKYP